MKLKKQEKKRPVPFLHYRTSVKRLSFVTPIGAWTEPWQDSMHERTSPFEVVVIPGPDLLMLFCFAVFFRLVLSCKRTGDGCG